MIYLFIFVLSSGKEIFTSSTKRSWNFFFDASWIQKRMDGSSSRTGWYRRPLIIIQSLGYIGRDCYRFSSTAQEKYSHTPCLLFSSLRNFSPSFLFFLPFLKSARSEIGISIVEKSGWSEWKSQDHGRFSRSFIAPFSLGRIFARDKFPQFTDDQGRP